MQSFIIEFWPFLLAAVIFGGLAYGIITLVLASSHSRLMKDWHPYTMDDKYRDDQMAAADIRLMAGKVSESNDIKACARVAKMPFKARKPRSDKGKPRGKRVTMGRKNAH